MSHRKKLAARFGNMKMKNKIIFTYIILSIFPIFALNIFTSFYINTSLVAHEKVLVADSLQKAALQLDAKFDTYNTLSNYIFNDKNILSAVNDSYSENYFQMYMVYTYTIEPNFLTYYALHSDLDQLSIFSDSDLHPLSNYVLSIEDIQEKPWFAQVSNRYQPTWLLDTEDGTKNLLCVRRLMSSSKYKHANYLYMKINYAGFFQPLKDISLGDYGVVLLDEGGNVLYEQALEGSAFSADMFREGLATLEKEQGDYMFLEASYGEEAWKIYYYQPVSYIVNSVNRIVGIIFLTLWLVLFLLGTLAMVFSNMLVRPIEELTKNMEAVDGGDLAVTVSTNRTDEIGIMITSFTAMIDRINSLIQIVYKNEIEKREFQLKILHAQINPHFLYNVLSQINSKAIVSGNEEISRLALLISSFYRTALNHGKDMTTVENELENVRAYIGIQMIMCNQCFDVSYTIDESLLYCQIPNFILQPIVENAIEHGLLQSDNTPKLLSIALQEKEDKLAFIVVDNGAGMEEEIVASLLKRENPGYGMENVDSRLALLYQGNYEFHAESLPGEGTRITIIMPKMPPESRK